MWSFAKLSGLILCFLLQPPVAEAKVNGSFKLTVDSSLNADRAKYKQLIDKGILNIQKFAKSHGWNQWAEKSVVNSAEFVTGRKALEQRIIKIFKLPKKTRFPKGLSAANDSKDKVIYMPESEAKKYSAKFIEEGFFEKLVTHEMAHLLHIKILQGKEGEMGPVWFYEGFAVVVARQLESFKWEPTRQEAEEIMSNKKRGDYRQYGYLLRQLQKKHPMKTIVKNAKNSDFNQWAVKAIFE